MKGGTAHARNKCFCGSENNTYAYCAFIMCIYQLLSRRNLAAYPSLNGTIAFGISLLLVFFILTSQKSRNFLCYDMKAYGIASFMLLSLAYMFYSHESFTKSGFLVSFYCFVMMCIGAYMHDKEKERKIILLYILAEVILKEICDIYELAKNPMIIRDSGFDVLSVNGTGIEKLVNIPSIYTFAVIFYCSLQFQTFKA